MRNSWPHCGRRTGVGRAFVSIEVPGDWETLRSIDCPADTRCRDNLALIAANGYVSLMGYEYHGPYSPGSVTGNDSNLYSDPDEPLLPKFYHGSDDQAVGYLTFRSVPTGKILLGFPAYFVSYGGVEALPGSNGLYQPFDRAHTATYDVGTQGKEPIGLHATAAGNTVRVRPAAAADRRQARCPLRLQRRSEAVDQLRRRGFGCRQGRLCHDPASGRLDDVGDR